MRTERRLPGLPGRDLIEVTIFFPAPNSLAYLATEGKGQRHGQYAATKHEYRFGRGEAAYFDADVMDARDIALTLLANRAADATVCPSEVARALAAFDAGRDWRSLMPTVHSAIDGLLSEGAIRLSWKGETLATRAGPYRIERT